MNLAEITSWDEIPIETVAADMRFWFDATGQSGGLIQLGRATGK